MKKIELYELIIKVFGLLLLVKAIEALFGFLIYSLDILQASNSSDVTAVLIQLFHMVLLIAIGITLIKRSGAIVVRFSTAEDQKKEVRLGADKKSLLEIALVLAGFDILLWALPDMLVYAEGLIRNLRIDPMIRTTYDNRLFAIAVLRFITGLLAILYRQQLINLFMPEGKNDSQEA